MAAFGSAFNVMNGLALPRAAEAMLRALGGSEVLLRFSGTKIAEGAAANPRLGLGTNTVEDVSLSPVVVRSEAEGAFEFVLPAGVVDRQAELRQAGTAKAMIESALGLVYNGKIMRIESVSADFYAGAAYLYRVAARE